MSDTDAIVAVYATHSETEKAIKWLQDGGVDMRHLSIVGKDYHTEEHVLGYYNTSDRMETWGRQGAFWGGVWGILFGSAFFWVPAVGPVLVGGPIIAMILAGLEGAVVMGGFSALGAALASIGIPKDSILQYQTELRSGKFLLIVHGTKGEVHHASELIAKSPIPQAASDDFDGLEANDFVDNLRI
ncbi:MAG: general stress protein [Planctomycetaceae bacterium]